MKIILFVILALPFVAHAQFNKGLIFVGGSLSTSVMNGDNHNTQTFVNTTINNSISISPTIGFLLSDKLAFGTSVNFNYSLLKQESPAGSGNYIFYKNETKGFGISPFVRYYFPLSNSAYLALQGALSFSRATSTITESSNLRGPDPGDNYSLGLNFKPVFLFFPAPKWGVEASVGNFGYNYIRTLPDVSSTSSFGLGWGTFSFGIAYYFLKK